MERSLSCACPAIFNPDSGEGSGGQTCSRCAPFTLLIAIYSGLPENPDRVWPTRQLNRQIESQFYERTVLSKDKSNMLRRGSAHLPADVVTPDDEIKDPYFLEFLALKDENSETDLEPALIMKLEAFLLELGGDFAFVGRQRRLLVGDAWYRVDLLFFHRRLRCLIIVDLKLGKFTHADAGQMHLYVNYAREHWAFPGENPPVGLILCAEKDHAMAKYALEGLSNTVLAAEY